MQKIYSLWDAAVYLEKNLKSKPKDARYWYGYLKNNSENYLKQDGYKLVCHVLEGKLTFTEASLKAFIKVHEKPNNAKPATVAPKGKRYDRSNPQKWNDRRSSGRNRDAHFIRSKQHDCQQYG